jgi:hypothetical protein
LQVHIDYARAELASDVEEVTTTLGARCDDFRENLDFLRPSAVALS